MSVALIGGCTQETDTSSILGNGDPGGSGEDPNSYWGDSLEPDPAEASAITNQTPRTIASVEYEGARMSTVIDDHGNVNEFAMFVDDLLGEYLGRYAFTTNAGRLLLDFDPSGNITTIAVEDGESGDAIQISLSWTDSTHALANMTDTVSNGITAFDVDVSKTAPKVLRAPTRFQPPESHEKWTPRAEPIDQAEFEKWKLSLPVKVYLVDKAGDPVANLRPVFTLRVQSEQDGKRRVLTCGAVRGKCASASSGSYFAMLPTYGYVAYNGDDYLATVADTVGEATTPVGAILLATPVINKAIGAGVTLTGGILWAESKLNPREYNYVPHPTALGGNDTDEVVVRVTAGDPTNATASERMIRYELDQHLRYKDTVDLGTLVVETTPVSDNSEEYVVYYVDNVRCFNAPSLHITEREYFDRWRSTASYDGGGMDSSEEAIKVELQGGFASPQEAADWLCPRFESQYEHYWCGAHYWMDGRYWWFAGGGYDDYSASCDFSELPVHTEYRE